MNKSKLVFAIGLTAFVLNLIWENAQAPWYQDYGSFWRHFLTCLWGTIGDVIIVLLLYASFAGYYRDQYWIEALSVRPVLMLGILGLAVGVGVELWALSTGRWAYTQAMPVIPGLGVGLLPVLQMMILPSLTFFLAAKILKR